MITIPNLSGPGSFWGPMALPLLLSIFLSINMGGSGTAPAFSAAYGAGALQKRMIPVLFGTMVLLGALLAGSEVTLTLGKGLLEQSLFTPMVTSLILFSIGISLLMANLLGVPQSTSQSTVLSIAGAAMALRGLNTKKLFFEILPTWFILPLVAFLIMLVLSRWVLPFLEKKYFTNGYDPMKGHTVLRPLLVGSSLYVAFSIGANNVANAVAPITSLGINQMRDLDLPRTMLCSILLTSPFFAIGSFLFGYKGTKSTGKEIVQVGPFYACSISLLVATLLLSVSVTRGIPTSLVQLNGAAFIALGISKNGFMSTFSNPTVKRFFFVWTLAPLLAFVISYFGVKLLSGIT